MRLAVRQVLCILFFRRTMLNLLGITFLMVVAVVFSAGCSERYVSSKNKLQFGEPVKADSQQETLKNALSLSTTQPSKDLAADAEVILVSGYEPSNQAVSGTKTKVVIDRPGSNVLLILTSYEKMTWQVEATQDTRIKGILASGYKQPVVITTLSTRGYLVNLPYSCKADSAGFQELLNKLNSWFGIKKIDAFRGSYSVPSCVTISELDRPHAELTVTGLSPKKPPVNFTFDLATSNHGKVQWSLTGPVDKRSMSYRGSGTVASSPMGDVNYMLSSEGLEIVTISGNKKAVAKLPPNFPEFSHPTGVAYDTRHDIVTVVSLGGEGFLYRFDAKKRSWIDFRSLREIDIFSLSYDQVLDRYVAWSSSGELLFINSDGAAMFNRRVLDRLPGVGRLYDASNSWGIRMTVFPRGNDIALVCISGGVVKGIWYYDVNTDTVLLTYTSTAAKE